jgi:hypothetical protein
MAYSFLYVNEKQSIIRAYYRFQNLDEEVKMQLITLKEEILSSFKVI